MSAARFKLCAGDLQSGVSLGVREWEWLFVSNVLGMVLEPVQSITCLSAGDTSNPERKKQVKKINDNRLEYIFVYIFSRYPRVFVVI